MTPTRPTKVFLERPTYRRRRLMDAARLLPVLGALLLAVPLLWPRASVPDPSATPVAMSVAITYVFAVWLILIVMGAVFGFFVRSEPDRDQGPDADRD